MKNIFDKSDIPLVDKIRNNTASSQEEWTLAVKMINGDGFTTQCASIAALLHRGAARGNVWCMTQLAREYFCHGRAEDLPLAVMYWSEAIRLGDDGAKNDIVGLDVPNAIRNYKTSNGGYADIEMKCAMLCVEHLTSFGAVDWSRLACEDKINRSAALIADAIGVLNIPAVEIKFSENLMLDAVGRADGLARLLERIIEIDKSVLSDIGRFIQVIFHELGHFAVAEMWSDSEKSLMLREMYGITPSRVQAWYNGDMGRSVSVFEEDPDTMSYGVYTQWAILFGGDKII